MKKVVALLLVIVLILGVAGPAAAKAVLSNAVSKTLPTSASENVKMHNRDEILTLSDEIQNLMAEAGEALKKVDTRGLALKYFFYMENLSEDAFCSVVFDPIPHNEILFMQYVDGMWVTLEHSIGKDGKITIAKVVDGPMAIFVNSRASAHATKVDLLPVLTDESYLVVQLHTVEEVVTLSEEIQNRMAEAKNKLKDVCPEGFAVKYFFELEVLGAEGPIAVGYAPIACNEIMFKQYVNNAWVELEHTVGNDGVITVSGLVNGPVATFIK